MYFLKNISTPHLFMYFLSIYCCGKSNLNVNHEGNYDHVYLMLLKLLRVITLDLITGVVKFLLVN